MIFRMGVEVLTGFRLSSKDSWKELDKFDAVFLAVGAHESIMPRISGNEESRVVGGLEFLKEVNSGLRKSVNKRVAVVGGGNTAIDAARICRRLGADVTILYRRSRKEMPAHFEEILSALREGVALKEQCLPVRIESGPRGGMKVVCLQTEPKGKDASGRILYEPAKGPEFVMDVGMLIRAVGQAISVPKDTGPVEFSPEGIRVGRDLRCGEGKYFAGGDAVPGLRRVCDAIGSGKLGALSIHCFLEGLNMDEIWTGIRLGQGPTFSMNEFMENGGKPNPRLQKAVDSSEINFDYFREIPQPEPPRISPEKAVKSFEEVVGDVDEEELSKTVGRCFSCGTCTACDICYMYCPDLSVRKTRQGYEFNYDYCKGCAICAEECPRGVIHMEREET
jgi:2-oxoacid:acceptor oxidoreductase delta subunit (pyruvate/2-ketoisovalerate family)